MTSKMIEITIISCEDLTTTTTTSSSSSRNTPIRKNTRAVIKLQHCTETQSTTFDVNNGSYPHWNEKFKMQMPTKMNWFEVQIWCGMEKLIGTVRIPASDFVGGILPDGYLNFLSYRLREKNGEFNGILNVSVRVTGGDRMRKEVTVERVGFECGYVIGVPSGAVVTGIPVFSRMKV